MLHAGIGAPGDIQDPAEPGHYAVAISDNVRATIAPSNVGGMAAT